MWWGFKHFGPLVLGGISGSHCFTYSQFSPGDIFDLIQGFLQVLFNIVIQGLEGGDVQAVNPVFQYLLVCQAGEFTDYGEEGSEGFTGTSG